MSNLLKHTLFANRLVRLLEAETPEQENPESATSSQSEDNSPELKPDEVSDTLNYTLDTRQGKLVPIASAYSRSKDIPLTFHNVPASVLTSNIREAIREIKKQNRNQLSDEMSSYLEYLSQLNTLIKGAIRYGDSDHTSARSYVIFPSRKIEALDSPIKQPITYYVSELGAKLKEITEWPSPIAKIASNRLLDFLSAQAEQIEEAEAKPSGKSTAALAKANKNKEQRVLVTYAPKQVTSTLASRKKATLRDILRHRDNKPAKVAKDWLGKIKDIVSALSQSPALQKLVDNRPSEKGGTGEPLWEEVKGFFEEPRDIFCPDYLKLAMFFVSPETFSELLQHKELIDTIHASEGESKDPGKVFLYSIKNAQQNGGKRRNLIKSEALLLWLTQIRNHPKLQAYITPLADAVTKVFEAPASLFEEAFTDEVTSNIADQIYYNIVAAYGTPEDLRRLEKREGRPGAKTFLQQAAKEKVIKDMENLVATKDVGESLNRSVSFKDKPSYTYVRTFSNLLTTNGSKLPEASQGFEYVLEALARAFDDSNLAKAVRVATMNDKATSSEKAKLFKQAIFSNIEHELYLRNASSLALVFADKSTAENLHAAGAKNVFDSSRKLITKAVEIRDAINSLTDSDVGVILNALGSSVKVSKLDETKPEIETFEDGRAPKDNRIFGWSFSDYENAIGNRKLALLDEPIDPESSEDWASKSDTEKEKAKKAHEQSRGAYETSLSLRNEIKEAFAELKAGVSQVSTETGNILPKLTQLEPSLDNVQLTPNLVYSIMRILNADPQIKAGEIPQEIQDPLTRLENYFALPTDKESMRTKINQYSEVKNALAKLSKYKTNEGFGRDKTAAKRNLGFSMVLSPLQNTLDSIQNGQWSDLYTDEEWSRALTRRLNASKTGGGPSAADEVANAQYVSDRRAKAAAKMAKILMPGTSLSNAKTIDPSELKQLFYANLGNLEQSARMFYNTIYNIVQTNPKLRSLLAGKYTFDVDELPSEPQNPLDSDNWDSLDEDEQEQALQKYSEAMRKYSEDFLDVDNSEEAEHKYFGSQLFNALHKPIQLFQSTLLASQPENEGSELLASDGILKYRGNLFNTNVTQEYDYGHALSTLGSLPKDEAETAVKSLNPDLSDEDIAEFFRKLNIRNQSRGKNPDGINTPQAIQILRDSDRKLSRLMVDAQIKRILIGPENRAFQAFTSAMLGLSKSQSYAYPVRVAVQSTTANIGPKTSAYLNLATSIEHYEDIENFLLGGVSRNVSLISYLLDMGNYPALVNQDRSVALATRAFILKSLLSAFASSGAESKLSGATITFLEGSDTLSKQLNSLATETFKKEIATEIINDLKSGGSLEEEYNKTLALLQAVVKSSNNFCGSLSTVTNHYEGKVPVEPTDVEALLNIGRRGAEFLAENSSVNSAGIRRIMEDLSSRKSSASLLSRNLANAVEIMLTGINYDLGTEATALVAKRTGNSVAEAVAEFNSDRRWVAFVEKFKALKTGNTTTGMRAASIEEGGTINRFNAYLQAFTSEFSDIFRKIRRDVRDEHSTQLALELDTQRAEHKSAVESLPIYFTGFGKHKEQADKVVNLRGLDSKLAKGISDTHADYNKSLANKAKSGAFKDSLQAKAKGLSTVTARPGELLHSDDEEGNLTAEVAKGGELISRATIKMDKKVLDVSKDVFYGMVRQADKKTDQLFGGTTNYSEGQTLSTIYTAYAEKLTELELAIQSAYPGNEVAAVLAPADGIVKYDKAAFNDVVSYFKAMNKALVGSESIKTAFVNSFWDDRKVTLWDIKSQMACFQAINSLQLDKDTKIEYPLISSNSPFAFIDYAPGTPIRTKISESFKQMSEYKRHHWTSLINQFILPRRYTGEQLLQALISAYTKADNKVVESAPSLGPAKQVSSRKAGASNFSNELATSFLTSFFSMSSAGAPARIFKTISKLAGERKAAIQTLSGESRSIQIGVNNNTKAVASATSPEEKKVAETNLKKFTTDLEQTNAKIKSMTSELDTFINGLVAKIITKADSNLSTYQNAQQRSSDAQGIAQLYRTDVEPIKANFELLVSLASLATTPAYTGTSERLTVDTLRQKLMTCVQSHEKQSFTKPASPEATVESILNGLLAMLEDVDPQATPEESQPAAPAADVTSPLEKAVEDLVTYYRYHFKYDLKTSEVNGETVYKYEMSPRTLLRIASDYSLALMQCILTSKLLRDVDNMKKSGKTIFFRFSVPYTIKDLVTELDVESVDWMNQWAAEADTTERDEVLIPVTDVAKVIWLSSLVKTTVATPEEPEEENPTPPTSEVNQ